MLITHWGLSGPAILKLSAWAARELEVCNYHFDIKINFLANLSSDQVEQALQALKKNEAKRLVSHRLYLGFPLRLWQSLVASCGINDQVRWVDLNNDQMAALRNVITGAVFAVRGKSTFKEEFVTAGGIALNEVDFKTAQSKRMPGLYFAGECLNIDGITGGFNFQAAWTLGMHAGSAMAGKPLA
ncbi:MAG TPA: aminoacetone oxidase family FAD-binding enzyme, partial [Opitutales bacterium]|nr:aminoacetone oxidase family FAD-binding enzyme [Opitutales bacterium]